jgi:hypothetical protein
VTDWREQNHVLAPLAIYQAASNTSMNLTGVSGPVRIQSARLVGRTVSLNDEDYSVIGIMPPGFQFPSGLEMPVGQQFASATEVWTPLTTPGPAIQNDRITNSPSCPL